MTLKVEKISKRFGSKWALRDVSFRVDPPEIFGIFGPNGAGKSTILKIVTRRLAPDSGSWSSFGFERARDVPIISSRTESEPSFFGRVFGREGQRNRVDEIESAIENAGGLILLDEPFCALDSQSKERFIDKILKKVDEKKPEVLLATSDFDLVFRMCDRAAVLIDGEIRQTGTPQEIYDRPESREVAAIAGQNNLFEARRLTSSKADTPEFQTIDGGHRLFTQKLELKSLGAINKNATLAIRPEHISISFGASFPEDNLLRAVIAGVHFRGATTMIDLDCEGLRLKALVLRLVGLNAGDECMVGLPPDRIQVF